MVKFEMTDTDKESFEYPRKGLALYDNINKIFKALVHSMDYNTSRKVEG